MANVFVTRKIPESGLKLLQKKHIVRVYSKDQVIPRRELIKGVKWADALLCLLTDKIDKKVLAANPYLKVISNYAVGYDNIDIDAAIEAGIPVTNTPGVLTQSVAEHTAALAVALAKRVTESDNFTRKGSYKGWEPMLLLGTELKGKTFGVVGLGRIGSAVADIMHKGFGMDIVYFDIKKNKAFEKRLKASFEGVPQLLKKSDIVSIHVPLLDSTHHLIGARQFRSMKKSALLVNTSRGPVVDEKALVTALKNKTIRGAALDVFEFEPKLTKGLAKLPNVILTPHTASATEEAREAMSLIAAENILAVLSGKKPKYLVKK
ncbi:MAG: D-glycerate dehydrogenase [Candidatus Jacksonbacteria bacterium]|jgi:glyoxylate reductase|nr:D-glycerate dehydrogenase [Candidatus Jacksonbacteria bacterium]MBT7008161.1 D-glycerate dehydrogenase [Candidatus Jacksonbacteria bacterium]